MLDRPSICCREAERCRRLADMASDLELAGFLRALTGEYEARARQAPSSPQPAALATSLIWSTEPNRPVAISEPHSLV